MFATGQGLDKAHNLRGGLVDWVRNRLPVALPQTV
jgi:rhodanese-related sulfurtransferase